MESTIANAADELAIYLDGCLPHEKRDFMVVRVDRRGRETHKNSCIYSGAEESCKRVAESANRSHSKPKTHTYVVRPFV